MTFVGAQGFSQPYAGFEQYVAFGSSTPVMRGFYLAYDVGSNNPNDHQINLMQVLAGGQSQDLTPNADLQPSEIPDGELWALLQDSSPKGEQFYYRVSHSLISGQRARRFQYRDVGCVNECVQQLPPVNFGPFSGLFSQKLYALTGFEIFFTGDRDYKLRRVGVWFDQENQLHVAFRGADGGETFGYLVDFVVISVYPTFAIYKEGVSGTIAGGVGGATAPIVGRNTDFLLTGWQFNFRDDGHNIREIGILPSGDNQNISVFYSDKNQEGPFDWSVQYAYIAQAPNI